MIGALIIVGVIYGWAAATALHRFSNRQLVRITINRIVAHLMELELFIDSPALVFRAQRALIRENLRLLRLVLPASLIPAAIFVLFYPQLEAVFGHSPLRIGDRSVVTAAAGDVHLEAPAGIAVETPAVNDIADGQTGWRVRPLGKVNAELRIRYDDGRVITRRVVAGSGWIEGWRLPFMRPAIDIRYPRRNFYGLHWTLWFFAISLVAAAVSAIRLKQ